MNREKISSELRAYFKSKGVSHKEAAAKSGYKTKEGFEGALSRGVFSKKMAKKLSAAYGFSMQFLLSGEGQLFETEPETMPSPKDTSSPSKRERRLVAWERTGGRCCYCKRPLALNEITIEHITPQSKFFSKEEADADNNIIACCSKCNTAKGDLTVEEFANSILSKNQALLEIEKERKSLLVKALALTQQINSKKFSYVQYLRQCQNDDMLLNFIASLKDIR